MPEPSPNTDLSETARRELAPRGAMRLGLAVGNTISAVWTMRDAEAEAGTRGPTVDLGTAFARWLGLSCEYVHLASSAEIIATADEDRWDAAFTPVDAERKTKVDFTPDYYLGDSTYMVHRDSPFQSVKDVDREGVRVVGIEGTATIRSSARTLTNIEPKGVTKLDEALDLFRNGEADAVALGRESLLSLAETLPDGRILPDHFHATGTALAVPKGHGEALKLASQFIEEAKASGLIEEIVTRHGMPGSSVAPPGSRS